MNLGENIYNHRTAKGWSQTELADALDVSRQSVSKWENNTATPDLDKLIKMHTIFDITLDELVFGERSEAKQNDQLPQSTSLQHNNISFRTVLCTILLIFGMTFFLLSIFFGDNLYFGEAFGELVSVIIVLLSVFLLAPYNFRVFSVCAIIFFMYNVICFGVLNILNPINSIFTFTASVVITVWFIVCGLHATAEKKGKSEALSAENRGESCEIDS